MTFFSDNDRLPDYADANNPPEEPCPTCHIVGCSPNCRGEWPDHPNDCADGCRGRGYRYSDRWAEFPEECTGRPYRFVIHTFDEDNGTTYVRHRTDDEAEAAQYSACNDPTITVTDRDAPPRPEPVDLKKYPYPF